MLTNFLLELIKVFDGYTSLRKRLFRKIPCLLFKQKFKNLSKKLWLQGVPQNMSLREIRQINKRLMEFSSNSKRIKMGDHILKSQDISLLFQELDFRLPNNFISKLKDDFLLPLIYIRFHGTPHIWFYEESFLK